MALQNKKEKLPGYQCLFKYTNSKGQIEYYAEVTRQGTRYGQKNLTKLFSAKTPKQAETALNIIYSELDKGNDPFNIRSDKLDDLFEERLSNMNEPTKTTKKYQYDKWVKPTIGHLKIGKITLEHLYKIMNDVDNEGVQPSTKLALKEMLSPIFKEEYERSNIDRNILTLLKIKVPKKKFKVPVTHNEMSNEVKKLFHAINIISDNDGNTRALFLAVLLTGRRIGELEQLLYSDIDFNMGWVSPRPETTKTLKHSDHLYKYPLPKIVIELLEGKKESKEKVFTHHKASYTKRWRKLLTDNNINSTYTAHKTRHFFISIMSAHYDRTMLGEVVLSHTGDMDSVYLTYSDEQIRSVYEKYWEIVLN